VLRSGPVLQSEPVSPELVLVDPELARRERARLEERAYLDSVLATAALQRQVEISAPPVVELLPPQRPRRREYLAHARRRVVPAALLCSLLANGFLVAKLVTRESSQSATPVAVRIVTAAPETSTIETSATVSSNVRAPSVAPPPTAKADVEQKLASLIISAPSGKLPRKFIDPATGLVKNNVHVVCKPRPRHAFLCAIRLPANGPRNALFVRYRAQGGSGTFTWYGYKRR
jgi:hypothetical protein